MSTNWGQLLVIANQLFKSNSSYVSRSWVDADRNQWAVTIQIRHAIESNSKKDIENDE